jgi:hypothetical protein
MDHIQINPENVAPLAPRQRMRKVAAYLLYRQMYGGGGNLYTLDFQTRVLADGGTLESLSCLNQSIRPLFL